jgi:hypothetical protein
VFAELFKGAGQVVGLLREDQTEGMQRGGKRADPVGGDAEEPGGFVHAHAGDGLDELNRECSPQPVGLR